MHWFAPTLALPEYKWNVAVLTLAWADCAVQRPCGVTKGCVIQLTIHIRVVAVITLLRKSQCKERWAPFPWYISFLLRSRIPELGNLPPCNFARPLSKSYLNRFSTINLFGLTSARGPSEHLSCYFNFSLSIHHLCYPLGWKKFSILQ